ncbi:MAG TPA: PspC domain-containing protein [Symbiobacteriaceae bacterium]
MRKLTRSRDRWLLGVAGGMAEYWNIDKTVVRAIWTIACVLVPPAILAYLVLAIVIPDADQPEPDYVDITPGSGETGSTDRPRRLRKSRDRILCGVCGGIAEYLNADPTLVRLLYALVVFLSFGFSVFAYIVLAIVMPDPASN